MNDETRKTISVPEAGREYFGLGKNASYAAAARHEIPVIQIRWPAPRASDRFGADAGGNWFR